MCVDKVLSIKANYFSRSCHNYKVAIMKTFILILAIDAIAAAVPKPTKLNYRNLYKPLPNGVKPKPSGPRIIGGREATPNSIPYQAFLEVYSLFEGWYCGGSLISQNYVLTAGHCGVGAFEADITLGAHKPQQSESTQVQVSSSDITVHKDYDGDTVTNDISVMRLSRAVSLTSAIQVVNLPSRSDASNTYEGQTARISGWGLTDGYENTISDVLNYVDVEVISNSDCERIWGSLLSSIICTSGNDDTGSCDGDSGGPLAINDLQIGIVSFGAENCPAGVPSAFTRVTSFLDWIADNTDAVIR